MSILGATIVGLMAVILAAILLGYAAKFITRQDLSRKQAYVLTFAGFLPALALVVAVRSMDNVGVEIAVSVTIGAFILIPGLVYGFFLKTIGGQPIGFSSGLVVAIVQLIFLIIGTAAIFLAIEMLRHM